MEYKYTQFNNDNVINFYEKELYGYIFSIEEQKQKINKQRVVLFVLRLKPIGLEKTFTSKSDMNNFLKNGIIDYLINNVMGMGLERIADLKNKNNLMLDILQSIRDKKRNEVKKIVKKIRKSKIDLNVLYETEE